jgi:phosphate-selective porin
MNILKIIAFVLLFSQTVFAFPEMIKHGYVNCTACHVSPSGGGVLNPYGRNLSSELISTWSNKGEEGFLHGAVDTSSVDEWLAIGGDYRGVQVHTDYTQKSTGVNNVDGRYINMQIGLELGIIQPKWAVVGFIGQYNFNDAAHYNRITSEVSRLYGLYKPTDEITLKVGRFQPNFGINLPDHNLSTRVRLEMGMLSYRGGKISIEDKEAAELFWLGEEYNFSLAGYKIRDSLATDNDKGFTFTGSKVFAEKLKVGIQGLSEKSDTREKKIYGLTGHLGWNEKWSTLAEVDSVKTTPNAAAETTGIAAIHRTGYEAFKGFQVLVLNDYYQSNVDKGSTKLYRYGPGLIWYPRPHFDFQLFYTKEQRSSLEGDGNYAWLMTHYYF